MGSTSTSAGSALSLNGTAPHHPGGPLDVLRFAAAFFVVLYSYGAAAPIPLPEFSPLFDRGYLATDFFLLLSGFVLARRYGAAISSGQVRPTAFLIRRLARLWPPHLIVLALMIGLFLLAGRPMNWSDIAPQALLVQAWGSFGGLGWNAPTWILSALVICYAGFPLVWKLMARLSQSVCMIGALALVFGADAFVRARVGVDLFALPQQFGILRALPLFVLGAAIARATEGPTMPRWLAVYALVCSLAGFILAQGANNAAVSVMALALALATIASMATGKGSKPAHYLGRLSFSLFITHILAVLIWTGFMSAFGMLSEGMAWATFGGSIAFAVMFAVVFERFVDRPLQAGLLGAFSVRRSSSTAPATA